MTYTVSFHIEKLPEGLYLATSDDVQGLVVQAGTKYLDAKSFNHRQECLCYGSQILCVAQTFLSVRIVQDNFVQNLINETLMIAKDVAYQILQLQGKLPLLSSIGEIVFA